MSKNAPYSKAEYHLPHARHTAVMTDTPSRQTKQIYDLLAPLYPLSSYLFHSNAHKQALAVSGIENGTRVLEVAMGSGEMFKHLVGINPDGQTIGLDLSPNMAAKSQADVRKKYKTCSAYCQAADARQLPFTDQSFDSLMCCYLLELLSDDDILSVISEFRRILRPEGKLTLILIAKTAASFNTAYKVCTKVAPAFWGRQVEPRVPQLLRSFGFDIQTDDAVKQIFYPSRVISATVHD